MSFTERLKRFFKPVDLRKGKEWKVLILFALPILASYLFQNVFSITDAAIVGQVLSDSEVAGINDVSPLTFIFLQFAFGCNAGFGVITANRVGEGDEAGIRRSFACQIILCLCVTAVITAISIVCLDPLLAWINVTPAADPAVYKAAHDYCLIIFGGVITQMFYNFIVCTLRSMGDSVTPLIFLILSAVLNTCLDLLFIVVFKWGVIGAAAATIGSQTFAAVSCFIYTFVKYKNLRLKKEDFKFGISDVKQSLFQGVPLGLQFSVLAVGIIVMQGELIKFDITPGGVMADGKPAQIGFGAANRLNGLLMTPFNALGAAAVSFNAQNYGAKEYDRIKRGMLQGTLIVFIMYIFFAGLGILLTVNGAYQYIFLSSDKITSESIRFGNSYLYVALSCQIILGVLFLWRNGIQGIEKSVYTLLAGTMELIARIFVCLFLPAAINGGPINSEASTLAFVSLCFADPLAWLGSVVALSYPFIKYVLLKKYDKKTNKIQPPAEEQAEEADADAA